MNIERWQMWIAAFDEAVATGNWDGLGEYLAPDATYVVSGVEFGCVLKGRDSIIAGFERSTKNFDSRLDSREWYGIGTRTFGDTAITCRATAIYERAGTPKLLTGAQGSWHFEQGVIKCMTDVYDTSEVDTQTALAWIERYGTDLDPSYC